MNPASNATLPSAACPPPSPAPPSATPATESASAVSRAPGAPIAADAARPQKPAGAPLTASLSPLTPPASPRCSAEAGQPAPSSVGKYHVLETIGIGGMGVVFKCWDPDLQRVVALKMIRAGFFARPSEVVRFHLERQALARVKHPHIVAIHDAGEWRGQPYFVLEHLRGGNLQQRLADYQADARAAALLVEKLARAVHALHRRSMLHRDLKPANILFNDDGEPLLTDFGLIKLLDDSDQELTRTHHRLGTPAYMAPEQTGLVAGAIGPAADQWALGVILYELVSGTRPFQALETTELFHKIAAEDPPPLRALRASVDAGLERIIRKCLAKDPRDRFASVELLADELGRWLRGEPLETQPEGWWARARRGARRHPVGAALAGLMPAALVAMLVVRQAGDPERQLRVLERDLSQNKTVAAVDKGRAAWLKLLSGKGSVQPGDDGALLLQADDVALFALVHDPQHAALRIKARLRHERVGRTIGEVGLFFGWQRAPVAAAAVADGDAPVADAPGNLDLYHVFAFDDVHDVKQGASNTPGFDPAIPVGNVATLGPRLTLPLARPWTIRCQSARSPFFEPAPPWERRWRELELELSPCEVQATFDGAPLQPLSFAASLETLSASIARHRLDADKPFLQGYVPSHDNRRPLGLFVARGSVSVAEVTLQPIPVPAEP